MSTLVGKMYRQGDARRDGAFTIFYMGINIGAFIAPLTCGTVGEIEGWGYGFLLAGIGMVVGLAIFLIAVSLKIFEDKTEPPAHAATKVVGIPILPLIGIGTFAALPVVCALIYQNDVMDYLLAAIGLAAISYILWLASKYPIVERQRMWVITILLLFTAVFWTFYELAGSARTFSPIRTSIKTFWVSRSRRAIFRVRMRLFIIIFAPVFSLVWTFLARRKLEPSANQIRRGSLVSLGAGFLILNLAGPFTHDAMIPAIFLILLYFLHTLGELALSPVGLSLVTKLAPAQIRRVHDGLLVHVVIDRPSGRQIDRQTHGRFERGQ